MNIQQIQNKHLEAIDFITVGEWDEKYTDKECDEIVNKLANSATKITLQAIVDKLTEINNRNKHQKYSDGYNSNIENEIEIITKQIEQL